MTAGANVELQALLTCAKSYADTTPAKLAAIEVAYALGGWSGAYEVLFPCRLPFNHPTGAK